MGQYFCADRKVCQSRESYRQELILVEIATRNMTMEAIVITTRMATTTRIQTAVNIKRNTPKWCIRTLYRSRRRNSYVQLEETLKTTEDVDTLTAEACHLSDVIIGVFLQ